MPGELSIEMFTLGSWQTNCFVVHTDQSGDCWVVDASFEPEPMIRWIAERDLTPSAILLTHGHIDHIAGIEKVLAQWPELPLLIHGSETEFLTDPNQNLSGPFGMPLAAPPATGKLKHGDTLALDGFEFELRHAPGHSPGGIVFYCPQINQAIVGDTLFAGSIGRYDLPHSDGPALMRSIADQLLSLPDDTLIYPGHGPQTSIGAERASNPYLR